MHLKLWTTLSLGTVFLVSILGSPALAKDDAPIIEINTGKIKGDDKESREDKDFFAYRGIPYARPPIGDLRFEPPQPPANWTGVKETENYEKDCLQYDSFEKKVKGSEDCLYLNVFTPKHGDGLSKKLLPVMVYIAGGQGEFFSSGSVLSVKDHKPHYFMDHDVVVVTFSYRLGPLGFLNTEDGLVPGNMGLKDQVAALQWVKTNIRKFAGDPTRVTIFGQGGGGVSCHYHMLSPMSKGLFQRAISQSGTVISPHAFQPHPGQAARRLGKLLKCSEKWNVTKGSTSGDYHDNSTALVNCLKTIDAKKLVEVQKESWSPLRNPLSLFLPSVETNNGDLNNETFLAEHPFSLLLSGKQRRVPWMTGINSEEGLAVTAKILNNKELLDTVENRWNEVSGTFLLYDNSRTDITEKVRNFYINAASTIPIVSPTTAPTTTTLPPPLPLSQSTSLYPNLQALGGSQNTKGGHQIGPNLQGPSSLPRQNVTTNHQQQQQISPTLATVAGGTTPAAINVNLTAAATSVYRLENFENNLINVEDKLPMITRLFTDRFFTVPLVEAVRIQSKLSPVHVYYNKYQGQFSFADVYAGKTKEPVPALKKVSSWFKTKVLGKSQAAPKHMGVCLSDEVPLFWKLSDAKVKEKTKDYPMSRELVKLWIQFASAEPKLEFRNITWSPVDPGSDALTVFQFSNEEKENMLLYDAFREAKAFWESIKYLAPFQQ